MLESCNSAGILQYLNCQTQDVRFCYLHPGFGSFNLQLFMLCVVKCVVKIIITKIYTWLDVHFDKMKVILNRAIQIQHVQDLVWQVYSLPQSLVPLCVQCSLFSFILYSTHGNNHDCIKN